MRRTITIAVSTGAAVAVLGGGLAMASVGDDHSSDDRGRPAATATPTARPSVSSPATAVDRAQAELIALSQVPGGRVESIESEQEHGRTVWSVRVIAKGVEHDIQIDRRTGTILRDRTGRDTSPRHPEPGHDAGDDRGGGRGGGHGGGGHDDGPNHH